MVWRWLILVLAFLSAMPHRISGTHKDRYYVPKEKREAAKKYIGLLDGSGSVQPRRTENGRVLKKRKTKKSKKKSKKSKSKKIKSTKKVESTNKGGGRTVVLTATMGIYPLEGTTKPAPAGFIEMEFDQRGGDINIRLNLFGMASNCSKNSSGRNECGVHIHQGTTCDTDGNVGGHYWNGAVDPWPNEARYNSDGNGRVYTKTTLPGGNGYSVQENNMHAVVVHDESGARISCGILHYY